MKNDEEKELFGRRMLHMQDKIYYNNFFIMFNVVIKIHESD